jgi:hypothetical protein
MDPINNYEGDSKKVKPCKHSCGKVIYWNQDEHAYFEIDSRQSPKCSNWKPSITKSQERLLQPHVNVVDTREETLTEILLKLGRLDRKLDKLGGV